MARTNTIVIEVRLTREPEAKDTAGGSTVTKVGLVHNIGKKDKQTGQWNNEPLWLDGIAFGKTAEALGKVGKGSRIIVSGQLSQDSWNDKATGQPRSKLVLIVNSFDQLEKQENHGRSPEPAPNDVPSENLYGEDAGIPGPSGEIPF